MWNTENDWWSPHRVFLMAQHKFSVRILTPEIEISISRGARENKKKPAMTLFKQTSTNRVEFFNIVLCCYQFNSNPFTSEKNQEANNFSFVFVAFHPFKARMSMTPDVKQSFPPTPRLKLHWHQHNSGKAVRFILIFCSLFSPRTTTSRQAFLALSFFCVCIIAFVFVEAERQRKLGEWKCIM